MVGLCRNGVYGVFVYFFRVCLSVRVFECVHACVCLSAWLCVGVRICLRERMFAQCMCRILNPFYDLNWIVNAIKQAMFTVSSETVIELVMVISATKTRLLDTKTIDVVR